MGQRSQHVLVVDAHAQRRRMFEMTLARAGYLVTIARDLDEATAVLRPALHPLIVHISVPLGGESDWDGSPLIELMSNPELAATHAFLVVWRGGTTLDPDVRERADSLGASYLQWLEMPTTRAELERVYAEAVRFLASRG